MEDFTEHIGTRLKRAREEAGLSIDDVMFRTRIPRAVVVALEAGDFAFFSSPIYAKSFLSQYSNLLKVNARVWIDALEPAEFVVDESASPVCDAVSAKKEASLPKERATNGWLSAAIIVAFSFALLYAGLRGYQYLDQLFGGPELNAEKSEDPKMEGVSSAAPPAAESASRSVLPETASEQEFSQPPPRAIIVR